MGSEATSTSQRLKPQTAREWFYAVRFGAIHLLGLAAIWTGVPWEAVALGVGLWAFRKFAITAGYHRYFSHRTYEMGRVMQFVMAFLSQTSMQKGVLWWASHHRHHHKHSDEPDDVHSPHQENLVWAHIGWLLSSEWREADLSKVKDLSRYPELRFLNRFEHLPALVMAAGCWLWMGWPGLIVGFVWSTIALWHTTFTINSLAHVWGSRRYETDDESRNNWVLALLTFGEGWHNNHHHYQASTRQGFYWWEIDITYYILWVMSKIGLVSNLRVPPTHVVEDRPHPARALRKRARRARQRFERRSRQLQRRLRLARRKVRRYADDLGDEAVDQIHRTSRDVEERLGQLEESVDDIGRGAHERLESLATEASREVEELSRRWADRVSRLPRHVATVDEEAVRLAGEIVDELNVQPEQFAEETGRQ